MSLFKNGGKSRLGGLIDVYITLLNENLSLTALRANCQTIHNVRPLAMAFSSLRTLMVGISQTILL